MMSAQRMANAPAQMIEKVPEVFISPKAVRSSEAESQVPKGFRIARPDEVALRYKTDSKFKKVLDNLSSWVWSGKIGLKSSGPHRIEDNGKFTKIKESEFNNLDPKDGSWHYPGEGRVALVGIYYWYRDRRLGVLAGRSSNYAARVAYVALEEGAPKNAMLLRKGQTLVLESPNGEITRMEVSEGTKVTIE
jgi:hypothetical protein